MNDENDFGGLDDLWLSRAEAARYVGVAGESAIRAAEAKGLGGMADGHGQVWHRPATLDAWPWRGRQPTPAQKTRVLRDAAKAREREARASARAEEHEVERELADADAQQARLWAEWDAEDALRAKVKRKADEMKAAFTLAHLDERTAGAALGFKSYEARSKLRDLVRCGLLRPIESPPQPNVTFTINGLREAAGPGSLCWGGPFFLREDVLALRRSAVDVARESPARAPEPVLKGTAATSADDIVTALLRMLFQMRRNQ